MAYETNLSTLIRASGGILAQVERQDVLVRRRDGDDLVLTRADHWRHLQDALAAFARLLRTSMGSPADRRKHLIDALPWTRYLSTGGQSQFVDELIEEVAACEGSRDYGAVVQVVHEWRETAIAQSNPELVAELAEVQDTDELVPRP